MSKKLGQAFIGTKSETKRRGSLKLHGSSANGEGGGGDYRRGESGCGGKGTVAALAGRINDSAGVE